MATLAVGLTGMLSAGTFPTENVDFLGNGVQMSRVATGSVPAKVVELKVFGNGLDEHLVDLLVDQTGAARSKGFTNPISLLQPAGPSPTPTWHNIDLCKQLSEVGDS